MQVFLCPWMLGDILKKTYEATTFFLSDKFSIFWSWGPLWNVFRQRLHHLVRELLEGGLRADFILWDLCLSGKSLPTVDTHGLSLPIALEYISGPKALKINDLSGCQRNGWGMLLADITQLFFYDLNWQPSSVYFCNLMVAGVICNFDFQIKTWDMLLADITQLFFYDLN